jgi:hypothetical protein
MGASQIRMDFSFTGRAHEKPKAVPVKIGLEDRAATIVVTLSTYPMRWFGAFGGLF